MPPIPFNPPDWVIQEYMRRKSPIQEILEGVGNVANIYNQQKTRKALLGLKQQESDRANQELAIKQGTFDREYNPAALPGAGGAYNQFSPQNYGDQAAPTLTGDAQTRSLLTQSGGPATLGPSMAQEQPTGPRSPILAHFMQRQGIGMGQNTALAAPPKNVQEQQNLEFANRFPLGMAADKQMRSPLDQKRTYSPQTFLDDSGNTIVGRFDTRSGQPEIMDEQTGEWIPAPPGIQRGYAPSYGTDPAFGGMVKRTAKGVTPVGVTGGGVNSSAPEDAVITLRQTAPKLADRYDAIVDESYPDKNKGLQTAIDAQSSASQVGAILDRKSVV